MKKRKKFEKKKQRVIILDEEREDSGWKRRLKWHNDRWKGQKSKEIHHTMRGVARRRAR